MTYITQYLKWQHFKLEIRFSPDPFNLSDRYGDPMAHLEVRVLSPLKAAIPITETGYRSHYTPKSDILNFGTPLEFVQAWLDHEAQTEVWKTREAQDNQFDLF